MSTEKTEKPSSHRLEKARNEGQIPRSKDFSAALVLFFIANSLLSFLTEIANDLKNLLRFNFTLSRTELFDPAQMVSHLGISLFAILKMLMPLLLVIAVVTLIANIILGGMVFSFTTIKPKFSKISPLSGIKKIFSAQSLMELIKSILKISLIFSAMYIYAKNNLDQIFSLLELGLYNGIKQGVTIIINGLFYMALVMVIIGLLDAPYQKWSHLRGLKMSKQELKDENKNRQGNPEIKSRVRRIQMEIANRRLQKILPTADVVITNPTHFAIAIKYDPARSDAPFVIAKGQDELAMHIKHLATKIGLEVLEIPPLARSVYYTTRINQQIPPGLYTAMTQVLHYVMRLKSFRKGQMTKPEPLPSFELPDTLRY
ncbi:MAG: flagellar biosynthesis protein FlhB [Plesiomonas sp.]